MQQNRRVDMVILSNNTELSDKEILNSILLGTFDPTQYPETGGTKDVLIPSGSNASSAQPSSSQAVSSTPPVSSQPSVSEAPPASSSSGFVVQPSGQEGQASLAPSRADSGPNANGNNSAATSASTPAASGNASEGIPQGAQVVSPYGG